MIVYLVATRIAPYAPQAYPVTGLVQPTLIQKASAGSHGLPPAGARRGHVPRSRQFDEAPSFGLPRRPCLGAGVPWPAAPMRTRCASADSSPPYVVSSLLNGCTRIAGSTCRSSLPEVPCWSEAYSYPPSFFPSLRQKSTRPATQRPVKHNSYKDTGA